MSHQDDVFAKIFIGVLIALAVFMVAAIILANSIGDARHEGLAGANDSAEAVEARIKPVGEVVKAGQPQAAEPASSSEAAPTMAAAAPAAARSGQEIYNTFCMACHMTGAAGAPILGNAEAWGPRVAKGFDAVLSSALNGKGAMPARGGNPTLTDDEIRSVVSLMFDKVGAAH